MVKAPDPYTLRHLSADVFSCLEPAGDYALRMEQVGMDRRQDDVAWRKECLPEPRTRRRRRHDGVAWREECLWCMPPWSR